MIKAVIVDDESKGIEILRFLIQSHCPDIEIVGYAEEVSEAIELINKKKPVIVFLDIEMSGESGFDLLEKVKPSEFHAILVTAHSQYAVKAFRYSVAGYLLKPVDAIELKEAIGKVKAIIKDEKTNKEVADESTESRQTLKIPVANRSVLIKMKDIIRMEADGAYTRIFLEGNRHYVVSYNIKTFEEHMDKNCFMRVHRSHIVNLNKIREVTGSKNLFAEMSDDSKVEISRRIRNDFILAMENKRSISENETG